MHELPLCICKAQCNLLVTCVSLDRLPVCHGICLSPSVAQQRSPRHGESVLPNVIIVIVVIQHTQILFKLVPEAQFEPTRTCAHSQAAFKTDGLEERVWQTNAQEIQRRRSKQVVEVPGRSIMLHACRQTTSLSMCPRLDDFLAQHHATCLQRALADTAQPPTLVVHGYLM